MTGEVTGRGRVEGSLQADQAVALNVGIEQIGGRLNQYALDGRGQFSSIGNRIEQMRGELSVGQNVLTLDGSLTTDVNMLVGVDANALDQLMPQLSGALKLDAQLVGPVTNPTLTASAVSTQLRWDEFEVNDLEVRLNGDLLKHTLSLSGEGFGVSSSISLTGGYAADQWDGMLEAASVENDLSGRWTLRDSAKVKASKESISVSKYCMERQDDGGDLCLDVDYAVATADVNASLNSRGIPLAAVLAGVSEDIDVTGTLTAQSEARMRDGQINGQLRIALEEGGLSTEYEGEPIETRFERAEVVAAIVNSRLDGDVAVKLGEGFGDANAEVLVEDLRNADSPISANVSMAVEDLTALSLFVPEIARPSGRLNGSLIVSGTLASPSFSGSLNVEDGRFNVPAAGIVVEDLNAELSQTQLSQLTLRGSARSGDGTMTLSGRTEFRTETGIRTELNVRGDNVELLRIPDREIAASPDLKIVFDDRRVELTGTVRIPSANLVVNELPDTAIEVSPDTVVHRGDEATASARRYRIDVQSELGENVKIAGFGLSTNVAGSLRITSSSGSVVFGSGRLSLIGGRYRAFGQELTIDEGELLFNGPLERPDLNVRATRDAGDVVAGVHLTGTPNQLRSTVYSEPALSDAEALSYLLTGRPLASASAGEGNTLNEAAFALGLAQAGTITTQIRNTLGLDTLAIEGGAESGRIVAGRRLGGRLFVEYGYGLVDQLGTLLLRLQLSKRLVVETSSGSTSTVDVVYSVKKK